MFFFLDPPFYSLNQTPSSDRKLHENRQPLLDVSRSIRRKTILPDEDEPEDEAKGEVEAVEEKNRKKRKRQRRLKRMMMISGFMRKLWVNGFGLVM